MEKIKALFHKYYELISYVFFGGLTTVVDFVIYYILLLAFGEGIHMAANVAAWAGAVAFAFFTNKKYVFLDKEQGGAAVAAQAVRFVLSRLFSLGVQLLLVWVGVEVLTISAWLVKLPVAVFVVILNYITGKFAVFIKKKKSE